MKQNSARIMLLLAISSLAQAHFVFVVPEGNGAKAKVILSEDLQPNQEVNVSLIEKSKLNLRGADGKDTPLTLVRADHAYEAHLPGSGLRLVHGVTDLGLMQRGSGKGHLLLYYPKTILGDAFDARALVGGQTPVEIVPMGKPGSLTLKLLAHGKAQPNAEITVILPDGKEKKIKTNATGETEALSETGRFGAWARFWEPGSGERDGKKYEELRHYATIVFDAPQAVARFTPLPQATSSFGAVESGGWLYVYGGHVSPTHSYWTEAVSGRFHRLNLAKNGKWEELPAGPPLQGLNLAAHAGKIYRIGGMAPRNPRGEAADNHSTADCQSFDPTTGKWEALPPLPQPRSSHDVVVVGNQLIVSGGWILTGAKQEWSDTLAVMDLSAKTLQWRSVPQPFRRRALIASAYQGKLYVIGGFNEKNQMVRNVSIYDPHANMWSEGPELPEPNRAFAPAAVVHQGTLYASVSDGTLLRLDEARRTWEKAGSATPRVAHRLAAYGDTVLVLGGAAKGNNFDLIEAIHTGSKVAR